MPVLTPEEYRKRASETIDPGYQIRVANENNAYNNTLNQYNQQIGNVNANYDQAIQGIQRNTELNQNQYSNNTLGRGLGRSTIATTGLAGIANTGTRLQAETNQERSQKINDLETLKTTLRTNLESSLKALSGEREGNINNMALQLQQRDEDIQRQLNKDAEDKRRYDEQMAWEKQKFYQSQSASRANGGLTTKEMIDLQNRGQDKLDKEYENYLQIGLSMRNARNKDKYGDDIGEKYTDEQLMNWVNGLGLSDEHTVKMLNALNIPKPVSSGRSNWDDSDQYYDPYYHTLSHSKLGR